MEGLRSPTRMLLEGVEGALLLVLAVVTWPLSRLFLSNLGARPDECDREWPGDRLLTKVDTHATRAITIRAPVAEVWPWLRHRGQNWARVRGFEVVQGGGSR